MCGIMRKRRGSNNFSYDVEKIELAQKASGMSVIDLSSKSGVSIETIYRVFRQQNSPTARTAKALSDALGLDIKTLIVRVGQSQPQEVAA